MNKRQEKVLIATLCGLVVTAAAGFVIQPANAASTPVQASSFAGEPVALPRAPTLQVLTQPLAPPGLWH
ncbi:MULTISPECIES: hypothetical protein [unclassified Devosia]|uniref:hypothetical protein n=1 Tax=unclassified Devosia TaxID=196773 RepID=UPI000FD9570F|nr:MULTISPECIES: hypothetical protein [unclassified Devosia]